MDLATLIGMLLGLGAVLGGFIMEGGKPSSLIEVSAAVIVLGGSIGATIVSFSMRHITGLPNIIKQAFFARKEDPLEMVKLIVSLAKKARQSGILALEAEAQQLENPFVRNAIQLVVDGTQPELVSEILDTEIEAMRERHKIGVDFFTSWGGLSPTLGVLGTVMGLVHMLENLSDPGGMGPSIAVAFIATFYGVGFANLVFLPIASKLKFQSHHELALYEMIVIGILALQAGENPGIVSTKMQAYLSPGHKRQLAQEGA
ncbi:MAG TPA: flagellar motor protein [Armatimonadota bacterium]